MGKLTLLIAGAALAGLPASSSAGAPVTVQFAGTITEVQAETPILDNSVQVGIPFSGSFTYDTEAVDVDADPESGVYILTTPPAAFRLVLGNYVFEEPVSQPNLAITIENTATRDRFGLVGAAPIAVSGPLDPYNEGLLEAFTTLGFGLAAPPPGPLSTDSLPPSVPILADWPTRTILIETAGGGGASLLTIQGNVTAIVPEPSAASLLLGSLAGLAALTRWRSRVS